MLADADHDARPAVDHPVFHQMSLIRRYLDAYIRSFDLKASGIDHIGGKEGGY